LLYTTKNLYSNTKMIPKGRAIHYFFCVFV
jgi:hypothetical protein